MPQYDKFLIGPISGGLQKNLKPWLIPDDAFEELNNAYIFRGRVKKRPGTTPMNGGAQENLQQLTSRLRIDVGSTDVSGDISGTVPGDIFEPGQMFSIGDQFFTVYQTGTPADMLISGGATTATFDTSNGNFSITGAGLLLDVYFYPALPVMGLPSYESSEINYETLYAFDTRFSYKRNSGTNAWERAGTEVWGGTNSDFFWTANYRGSTADTTLLYATNFVESDGIKYWDGSTWTTFAPQIDTVGDTIITCRVIVPFKDRLLFLNVTERIGGTPTNFFNRCRFCQNGSPLQSDAWNSDVSGKGDFLDAPINEQIVSAQLIRDRLIVFFERSTWEIVYTGNQVLPFRWQQINSTLGVESPYSVIPFDRTVLGIGETGIHACNGASVTRIDSKIPDTVFHIRNNEDAVKRVYGVRDYFTEMVYWTFPEPGNNNVFPQRILTYNYQTDSWAFFDDSFTCFGYFQQQNNTTWADIKDTWETLAYSWDSPQNNARFLQVVAGNHQGFTLLIHSGITKNAPSLQISNITGPTAVLTIYNHNLSNSNYIQINNAQGITSLNDGIYQVRVLSVNTIGLTMANGTYPEVSGTYTGGGTVSLVSKIDILTKQYDFYSRSGATTQIAKVDFLVDKTDSGEIAIDVFPSSSTVSLTTDGEATGALMGTNVLDTKPYDLVPLEAAQARLWHPVYAACEGQTVQLRIYHTPAQITDPDIIFEDFELHAMLFHATPGTMRLD